jgi:multiple sugar transport system substrate-binding protein
MTRRQDDRQVVRHLSRRQALRLLGGAGGAALLAACGGPAAPTTGAGGAGAAPTAPAAGQVTQAGGGATVTSAPVTAAPGTSARTTPMAATSIIKLPQTGTTLPSDKMTFHWVDSGDSKVVFFKAFFQLYQQAHPNVTMQYDGLPWAEIGKLVPLGVQNGNAPDVFQVPQGIPTAQAVKEGWVQPIEDVVPNFQQWKAAFPPNSFFEGITTFNGKVYTFPRSTSKRTANLIFYNVDQMQRAGYNPVEKPFTWDEFRTAAKKITQQGNGQYYGFITGGNQVGKWGSTVSGLAQLAGAKAGSGDINWQTGEFAYTSDEYLAAIDLLLALKADGSVFPGSLSINEADARSRTAQGAAAMVLAGEFCSALWVRDNPDFNFNVAAPPISGSGQHNLAYDIGANHQWLYAKSKAPAVAGEIFYYLGTEEGQKEWVTVTNGSDPAMYPQANQQADIDPRTRRCYSFYDQFLYLSPMPVVRNADVTQALLEQKSVQPNFGAVVQGLYTGQLKDPKAAMQDLQDRSDKELDRAIKAAQAKGAKVSRDDWKFPNWDPGKDYTEADYANSR